MQDDGAGDGDQPAAEERRRRERRRRRQERRRRAREDKRDTAEAAADTCELVEAARTCGGCGRAASRGRSGGGGDGGCGCDGPCDLPTLRLSPLLFLAAAVTPARGADGLVRAAVRGYQRWLSRFTPRCPGTPSCSTFALTAVDELGVRRGLAAAATRVRDCGSPDSG